MNFQGQVAPVFHIGSPDSETQPADGWGVGYYGHGEASASLHKEAHSPPLASNGDGGRRFEATSSSIFLFHVREARWGSQTLANTQPFLRFWSGREWMFTHCGSMRYPIDINTQGLFEPVGSTDSELIYCELMSRIAARKWRNLGYVDFQLLRDWFSEFNAHGSMNSVLTDGRDVCLYSDADDPLYLCELTPPHGQVVLSDSDLDIDLTSRGLKSHRGLIYCTRPLTASGDVQIPMRQVPPSTLTVIREGQIRLEIGPVRADANGKTHTIIVRPRKTDHPNIAQVKLLEVKHTTIYRYRNPVEHSTHLLRLTPIHDRLQRLEHHSMECSVHGLEREYEDVFGNQVRRILVQSPFEEMHIEAHSIIRLLDTDPLRFRPIHARTTLPLVWMPWQRHMLTPYLLPPELPEAQLHDLADYAMSFARRNDHDLLETLIDINTTMFREYTYLQGSTTVHTTAYEVFERRRGVCQDFANLFVCLARLLGVPARYVCGYIYCGPKNPKHPQSAASHAWAQVYLPEVGWKGFDPTNGVLTQTDHIRIAVGRNYIDATPTSGTIYVGGGGETLSVDVSVEPVGAERLLELKNSHPSRATRRIAFDPSAEAPTGTAVAGLAAKPSAPSES